MSALVLMPGFILQEKRAGIVTGGHQHLVTCLETLQKALKGEPGFIAINDKTVFI